MIEFMENVFKKVMIESLLKNVFKKVNKQKSKRNLLFSK